MVFTANLDRSVVHEKAVQLLESLAGAVRLVESDIGNATADRVGTVNEVDSLDGSDSLDKVFLVVQCVSSSIVEFRIL